MDPMPHVARKQTYILKVSLSMKYAIVTQQDVTEVSTSRIPQTPSPLRTNTMSLTTMENDIIDLDTPQHAMEITPNQTIGVSNVQHILGLDRTIALTKALQNVENMLQVNEMAKMYDITLEFPTTFGRVSNQMDLMENRYDPPYWTPAQTININYPAICRCSNCVGVICCMKYLCPQWVNQNTRNEDYFKGAMEKAPLEGKTCKNNGRMKCHYCNQAPICTTMSGCYVLYVMPSDTNYTRLMIHFGKHLHGVTTRTSNQKLDRAIEMVKRVVSMKPNVAHREVQLDVTKMIIDASLIEKGGETKNMNEVYLLAILDEVEQLVHDNW